jgi:hypothetical protein
MATCGPPISGGGSAAAGPSHSGRPLPAASRPVPRPSSCRPPRRRSQIIIVASALDENAPSTSGGDGKQSNLPPVPPIPPPADPGEAARPFPWWKALFNGGRKASTSHPSIYRLMDALDTAPRVRTRTAGDRKARKRSGSVKTMKHARSHPTHSFCIATHTHTSHAPSPSPYPSHADRPAG